MEKTIPNLAEKLVKLKEQKEYFEAEIKAIKEEHDTASTELLALMNNEGLESFKSLGKTFYTTTELRSSIADQEKAFAWLRANEYASIIKETVHSRTLGSTMKEIVADGKAEISQLEGEGFKVFSQELLRMRKS